MSLTTIRRHLDAAHRRGLVLGWHLAGPYIEVTWADRSRSRSRSLIPHAQVIARLRAQVCP